MQKIKIYLDTSAISHIEQPEKPSEQAYSRTMLDRIKAGGYVVCLSDVFFDEINDCLPERRNILLQYVSEFEYQDVPLSDTVKALAESIIERKYLPKKSIRDSQHIAAAIVAGCDYVISWNMKHMANVRTNKNIRHIIIDEGYKEIMIVPPSMLLEGSVFDDDNEQKSG